MKKVYQKPCMEMELYALDASIASNCRTVINSGPEHNGQDMCSDYRDLMGINSYNLYSNPHNVNFYEDPNCDCYTTSTGEFFTS